MTMEDPGPVRIPQLSVVIPIHGASPCFFLALEYLRRQTVSSAIEVVVITAEPEELRKKPELFSPFFGFQVIERVDTLDLGRAKTIGVFVSSAPLVAFMEDHSFPHPGWASALLGAFRKGDYAAVGPVVHNANPVTSVSVGCFFVFYGPWMKSHPEAELRHLPGNQSCYRRSVLLEYGSRLPRMLWAESILHWDLLKRGHRIYQEPSSQVSHMHMSRIGPILLEYFFSSWIFAATRSRTWRLRRRILFSAGSFLLPFLRLPRSLKTGREGGWGWVSLLGLFPWVWGILCSGAAGEMLGYMRGYGRAPQRYNRFEKNFSFCFTEHDILQARKQKEESPE